MSLGIARVTATNTADGNWPLNVSVKLGTRYIADLATIRTAQFAKPEGHPYFTQVVQVFRGGIGFDSFSQWGLFPVEMLTLDWMGGDWDQAPPLPPGFHPENKC